MHYLWLTPTDRELMNGTMYQSSHRRYWLECYDYDGDCLVSALFWYEDGTMDSAHFVASADKIWSA